MWPGLTKKGHIVLNVWTNAMYIALEFAILITSGHDVNNVLEVFLLQLLVDSGKGHWNKSRNWDF